MRKGIRSFLAPPTYPDDPARSYTARMLFTVNLLCLVLGAAGLILLAVIGVSPLQSYAILIGALAIAVSLVLLQRGQTNAASYLTFAAVVIVIYAIAYFAGGLHRPAVFINVIGIALAALILRNRQVITAAVLLGLGTAALYLAEIAFPGLNPQEPAPIGNVAVINIFILLTSGVILQIMINNLNDALQRARSSESDLAQKNAELQHFSAGLETLVAQRTSDLELLNQQMERRANQLQAVADVGRAVAGLQELETLLPEITQVIAARFNFYHVGIFLVDESREFAVLRASNSTGGARMLARGHRLSVGAQGIVGYVTQTGQARIAVDVGEDAAFFDNPDLPATRSEIALPLHAGERIIGALDVQSEQPAAFSAADIEALGALADQLSVAIRNAELYGQTRSALRQAESATRQYVSQGWRRLVSRAERIGFRQSLLESEALSEPVDAPEIRMAQESGEVVPSPQALAIPVRLRGVTIGVIHLRTVTAASRTWTNEEILVAQSAAERLALAVENARLIDETRRRADLERATSEISGRISESIRFETILRTAAEELSRALNGSEVLVQIQPDTLLGETDRQA